MSVLERYVEKVEDLFSTNEKYTFLVGAGISMDAPTNMPSARQIIRSLLNMCAPPEEVENLLLLDLLRFELVVEVVQYTIDEDLRFLDYLEVVKEPNLIHLFLGYLITKGHYVVTTNFDYLIERALMRILPENLLFNIYPIITKGDFISLKMPENLIASGKYPVYKIHGAKRNIITGIDTRDSLVTTISALGRDRAEGETFAIEPYKKPAVYNLTKNRTLIIMGYSGSDDFDIGPTLKELPFLNRVIWIEHSLGDQTEIFRFNRTDLSDIHKYSKVEQMLAEIRSSGDFEVFLIKTNTRRFIENMLWDIFLSDILEGKSIVKEGGSTIPEFQDWIHPLFKDVPLIKKYRLAVDLFYKLKQIDSTVRCSEKGLVMAENIQDLLSKSFFLNFSGLTNQIVGDYDKALEMYEEALLIDEKTEDLSGKATDLNNIGSIYLTLGKYNDAMEKYKEAMIIAEQLGDLNGKAVDFNNMGRIYEIRGEYDDALKYYLEALHIAEQLGDLERKSLLYNNIGMIYSAKCDYDQALGQYEEALKIAELLGDLYGKIILINNIGRVYHEKGNLDAALERYKETVSISEQLGDLSKKAGCLNNIGSIHLARKEFDMALNNYKEALNIEKRLGDPLMMAIYLNNIGMIHNAREDYDAAMKKYQEALIIVEDLGDISKVALFLSKIAMIYLTQENYGAALKRYMKSADLYGQLGDLNNKAAILSNIGNIHEKRSNFDNALKIYADALQIEEQIEDSLGKATDLVNIGRIYEKRSQYQIALEKYEAALQIFQQMGQAQYIEVIQKNINELRSKIRE